ncbi:SAM-dependent methyltransferase [Aquabacter spiritensis]|uniref:Methyltransferase family protein n=1 Tax=Aquabacter spiritensis TaxID=933073 RepID=A0A4R3M2U2_9HYPH|nr:SAM-dependent methyltransferase [Aquabacter spiritensis]TCT07524.1 hypothetical protein EDC64_10142 [Aquabacter spiritensis]
MSGFSADWLALREPADARARDPALARAALARVGPVDVLRVVDLGAGTGANLRAGSADLGPRQDWTLLDYDPALLAAARAGLRDWADESRDEDDGLALRSGDRHLTVRFVAADLSGSLDEITRPRPHLVTASAFFDLASAGFVGRLAEAVAEMEAVFHTVLTCNGRDAWLPPHPDDPSITAAFRSHQVRDKGFGAALGNAASAALETAFRAKGYATALADTPWRLGAESRKLIAALADGTAAAASETGHISAARASAWATARASAQCEIGHTDLLAWPERVRSG